MDKYMFFFVFLFFLVGNRLHQQPLFPLLPISGQQDNRVTGITQGKDFELRGPAWSTHGTCFDSRDFVGWKLTRGRTGCFVASGRSCLNALR
jgi:hypothetical protein